MHFTNKSEPFQYGCCLTNMFLNGVESSKLLITALSSLFLHLYTWIVLVKSSELARGGSGILSLVELKKKSLSRGGFGRHSRVIGNKNFFFGLCCKWISIL